MNEMTKKGGSYMPEKENPFNKKEDDDRNLFTDESDIFGEEPKKSRAGDPNTRPPAATDLATPDWAPT